MSIIDYIRNHEELSQLDFISVYYTILTLREDGYLLENPYFDTER